MSQKLYTVTTNSKSKISSKDNLLITDTVLMPQSMLITRPIPKLFPSTYPPNFHTFSASRVCFTNLEWTTNAVHRMSITQKRWRSALTQY